MNDAVELKLKKFVVVPRDAMNCLTQREATLDQAVATATEACSQDGMTIYIAELKAVVARADKPVKVKKL